MLYGKSEVLDNMPPWQGGGNMIQDVTFEKTLYQPPPQRFEAGTGNIADAVGLGAAIDYVDRVGIANVSRHEHMLLKYATEALPVSYTHLNVAASRTIKTRKGAPTPDDLDELLTKVWKEPSLFLAHPRAIAAFGRECTRRGVPPPTVTLFGTCLLYTSYFLCRDTYLQGKVCGEVFPNSEGQACGNLAQESACGNAGCVIRGLQIRNREESG